jgi:hypothetical protein
MVNLAWALVQFPLVSYEHLNNCPQRSTREDPIDIPMRPMGRSSSAPTETNEPTTTRRRSSTAIALISPWLNRIKRLLDLFATCWFVVGNYWLFTSKVCSVFYFSNSQRNHCISLPLHILSLDTLSFLFQLFFAQASYLFSFSNN